MLLEADAEEVGVLKKQLDDEVLRIKGVHKDMRERFSLGISSPRVAVSAIGKKSAAGAARRRLRPAGRLPRRRARRRAVRTRGTCATSGRW